MSTKSFSKMASLPRRGMNSICAAAAQVMVAIWFGKPSVEGKLKRERSVLTPFWVISSVRLVSRFTTPYAPQTPMPSQSVK